jgi:phage terminase small subunit
MSLDTQQPTAYDQLTTKQKAFVDALCLEPNISGTQAAINAGYNKKGAAVEAHHCLRNPKVRKALGERLKDVAPTSEEIALHWDRVSRASLNDFYTKKKVEVKTKVKQPLTEAIAAIEADIAYEYDFMVRAWEVLELGKDERAKELQEHDAYVRRRRLDILRHQMQLERDPAAFRVIDGPVKVEEELVLDLVKAQKAGVLDLARSIKPTMHGISVELRDQDAALDKLARMAGAYEKDNTQAAATVVLNTKVEIVPTGKTIARSESEVQDV